MPRTTRTPEERLASDRASKKRYRDANRERLNAEAVERYHADPDASRARGRANKNRYSANNRALLAEKERQAWAENPDHKRAIQRKSTAKHAEKGRANAKRQRARLLAADPEYDKHYYAANIEKRRAISAASAKRHPDRVNATIAKRLARIRGAKRNDVTPAQRQLVLAVANGRCAYCPYYHPGCQLCAKGAHKGLTVDHITAVAVGGDNTLHNLVACCRSCNCKKRTRPNPIPVQPLLL
jgi:HNH endonuclease